MSQQVRINKTGTEYSVDYHPSSSDIPQEYNYSHISIDTVGLFFSPEFLYPTMVAENFRIFGVQIIGKCICGSKNESRHLDQYLQEKLFTWFLSPTSEGNYSFFLARLFSKIYFPPKEMGEVLVDGNTVCGSLCSFHVL